MEPRRTRPRVLSLGVVALPLAGALLAACGSEAPTAGEPFDASASSAADGGPSQAADVVGGCPESPLPRQTSGGVLELPIEVFLAGRPMVFGERNDLEGGGALTPHGLLFYISDVELTPLDGGPIPVDLVTGAGKPEPYGVHYFNAVDSSSHALRILAPPGSYRGIAFSFGLNDRCNSATQYRLKPPLSAASQMSWPHLAGYLFLRFEAHFETPDGVDGGGTGFPNVIHMGGFIGRLFAPTLRVPGMFSIPKEGVVTRPLRVSMDEIFKGATAEVDLSDFPIPDQEVIAGERLRRTASGLPIFTLVP